MSSSVVLLFLATFATMEYIAWWLHKYAMHGFLWFLHEDHHVPRKDRAYQLNDAFAIFFAVPSFFSILFGSLYSMHHLSAFGYGIMAYGFAYFFVHEVIIHRRLKFITIHDNWYVNAVRRAHRDHHQVPTKEGASNFGMLVVPFRYFQKELSR